MEKNVTGNYIFVVFTAFLLVKSSKSARFDEFVRSNLVNYSTWLKNNNMDPSALVGGPSHFQSRRNQINIDCDLRNHGVRGHSSQIDIKTVNADFEEREFKVTFDVVGNTTFFGSYIANLTVPTETVQCTGIWHISVPIIRLEDFRIKFDVFPNGSLHIIEHSLDSVNFIGNQYYAIENLLEKESLRRHEYDVDTAFIHGVYLYLYDDSDNDEHPLRSQYLNYWKDIFQRTTKKDILGTNTEVPTASEYLQGFAHLSSHTTTVPNIFTTTTIPASRETKTKVFKGPKEAKFDEIHKAKENLETTFTKSEYNCLKAHSANIAYTARQNRGVLYSVLLQFISLFVYYAEQEILKDSQVF